ncbi:MAG: DNA primase [Chloroflexota bacterium]
MSTIDEVKTRIDIVDLVTESVQLRRTGKNYTGFCPFHRNERTPAFVVFPESGTWRCFGQCNEGGDIFKFVMKKENWDFSETLRYLAEKAGVQLRPTTPQEQEAAEEGDHLRQLLEDAVTFYRHQLYNSPGGKSALEYLRGKRGLTDETIEAFGLGYAPDAWDAALKYFNGRGVSAEDLLSAGLLTEREVERDGPDGPQTGRRLYDRFRRRIMIPIRDMRGRMAGFGARITVPEDIPKFLNSPQTPIFDKGHLLYGLDRARKAIRTEDQAVIVEGYLDVIALHQAGFANAVSPMGTALTEHQLMLLKRFSKRIVLALDPDAAGDQATLRGLQIARQAMDRQAEVTAFDARGLLGFEARLQADIRVTTLPPGMDPDEVVNRDPAEWKRILEEARPVVVHVMETLAAGRNLDDPKVKNELAAQVVPLIEDVPSPIERDTYRQRLARLLRVSESALAALSPAVGRPLGRPRPAGRRSAADGPAPAARRRPGDAPAALGMTSYTLEAHCLGVLLRRPDLLYQVDRRMQEAHLPRLSPEDFMHADHQAIVRLFQDSVAQDMAEPLNYVLNSLSLPLMDLADGLLARTNQLDPNDEKVLDDLMRGLLLLRQRRLNEALEYHHFVMAEAQERGDLDVSQDGQVMVQLSRVRHSIDRALSKYTSRSTPVAPRHGG